MIYMHVISSYNNNHAHIFQFRNTSNEGNNTSKVLTKYEGNYLIDIAFFSDRRLHVSVGASLAHGEFNGPART